MQPRSRRPGPTVRTRVTELRAGEAASRARDDRLITEEPLELRVEWPGAAARRVWVTMRTPGHDFELAAGWVVHEGLAPAHEGILGVAYCTDAALRPEQDFNVVTVTLAAPPPRMPHQQEALSAGSSACGVCGSDSIHEALQRVSTWPGALPDADVIRGLPDALRGRQQLFDRTGGVHASALVTADGEVLVVREDVGRHNTVDKVTGSRVLSGSSPAEACLVVSGRVGYELVQKALAAGIGSLVAVGAPTSLAVSLAREGGLVLHGFTGPGRTVRYT
ncbi:MAG: formate dehydrogenase accessory sulfurtransferase FdhD [Nocardioides sp.]